MAYMTLNDCSVGWIHCPVANPRHRGAPADRALEAKIAVMYFWRPLRAGMPFRSRPRQRSDVKHVGLLWRAFCLAAGLEVASLYFTVHNLAVKRPSYGSRPNMLNNPNQSTVSSTKPKLPAASCLPIACCTITTTGSRAPSEAATALRLRIQRPYCTSEPICQRSWRMGCWRSGEGIVRSLMAALLALLLTNTPPAAAQKSGIDVCSTAASMQRLPQVRGLNAEPRHMHPWRRWEPHVRSTAF